MDERMVRRVSTRLIPAADTPATAERPCAEPLKDTLPLLGLAGVCIWNAGALSVEAVEEISAHVDVILPPHVAQQRWKLPHRLFLTYLADSVRRR
jgi:hypothetical protein